MHLYDYTPQKNTKQMTGVILCLVSLGAGPFLFSLIIPNLPFKWVFQLFSIIVLTAVIFIISRFAAKSFLYSIIKTDDSTLDMTVTEITNGGRSKITVCRISVTGIEIIEKIDRADINGRNKQKELEKKLKPKKCAFCGKVFKPTQPPQRFCCAECRVKFFSRKQGIEVVESHQTDLKCVVCGTEFRGTQRQKYCSVRCKNKYRAAIDKAKKEVLEKLQKEYQK